MNHHHVQQEINIPEDIIIGAQLAGQKILEASINMGENYERVLKEDVAENLLFLKLHGVLRLPDAEQKKDAQIGIQSMSREEMKYINQAARSQADL